MAAIKWWPAFLAYTWAYCVCSTFWWVLYPFRMAQVELGSAADYFLLRMKEMVHDKNYRP